MKFCIVLLCLILLLTSCNCDGLKQIESEIESHLMQGNYKLCDSLIQEKLDNSWNSAALKSKLYYFKGKVLSSQSKYNLAIENYKIAISLDSLNSYNINFKNYNNLADAYVMKGKFDSARIYYNSLKVLFDKTNDSLILGYALKGLSTLEYVNHDETKNSLNELESLLFYYSNSELSSHTYYLKAFKFYDKGKLDSAIYYNYLALKHSEKLKDKTQKANCLLNLGVCYDVAGEMQMALNYYQLSLAELIILKKKFLQSTLHFNIANVNLKLNQFKEAAEHFELADQLNTSEKNDVQLYESNLYKGFLKNVISDAERLQYLNIAEKIALKNKMHFSSITNVYTQKAVIYEEQAKLDSAIYMTEKCLDFIAPNKNNVEAANILINLGTLERKKNKITAAIQHCTQAYDLIKADNNHELISHACKCLLEAYVIKNDQLNHLKYFKKYSQAKDSFESNNNLKQISLMQAQIQVKESLLKNESEISNLKENLDLKSQRNNIFTIASIALLFIIAIGLYLFFKIYKQRTKLSKLNGQLTNSNKVLQKQKDLLNESNQNLQNFAELAAHDINAPIHKLEIITKILQEKYKKFFDLDDQILFKYMHDSFGNLISMTNDLLSFSSITKDLAKTEKIDLKEIIQIAVKDISSSNYLKEIKINLNTEFPQINGHQSLLYRLFVNILSNAVKYSKPDVPLEINFNAYPLKDKYWMISIEDNGIGIPLDFQSKIFELFTKYHKNSQYPGNGIGLSICKKIVNFYGGEILVSSEEAIGTTISFTLPQI